MATTPSITIGNLVVDERRSRNRCWTTTTSVTLDPSLAPVENKPNGELKQRAIEGQSLSLPVKEAGSQGRKEEEKG